MREDGPFSQEAKIPTGADLNWRTVWPGQWTCDNAGYIWADSLKGGKTHMIDVRGWGYLTGRGHGALALDSADAERLQDQLGALLCAAPDLLAALKVARRYVADLPIVGDADLAIVDAAILRATTPGKPSSASEGVG